ncbi:baseplate J/gp47 family protein [Clostridium sp.]|uniref:baseplate J/gp47 family protein n=1 Tax=Clostridium sp. TaxID=1506 RepID=UPI0029122CC4|nr:baseplate J/gp47 family protein [Clostridium sp.]MDU4726403.1 baseplate J/gp47 family protein [Clostridium sp.]
MFDDMTYEKILNDMLSRVTNDVDKREGSIIYDALAPCAYKLAESYFLLNNFIDLVLLDTAVGEYLDRAVLSHGINRKEATYSIRKIETNTEIDIGTRWGIEDIYYTVKEKITDTSYKAICNLSGAVGNLYNGELENIDNVSGVTANLTDILEAGVEEESDEDLRNRFYNKVRYPSTSGNIYDYKKWALEVAGVGDAKVYPLWNGNGTVKVVIIDSNKEIANGELIKKVSNYIEEKRPIGATVTVKSAIKKDIDISVTIVIDSKKYILNNVKERLEENLKKYLKEIAFKNSYVSYASIGNIIFNTEGILDYNNLLLNNSSKNINLEEEEIPTLRLLNVEV